MEDIFVNANTPYFGYAHTFVLFQNLIIQGGVSTRFTIKLCFPTVCVKSSFIVLLKIYILCGSISTRFTTNKDCITGALKCACLDNDFMCNMLY